MTKMLWWLKHVPWGSQLSSGALQGIAAVQQCPSGTHSHTAAAPQVLPWEGTGQHTLMNGSHDGLELFRMFPVFAGSQWVTAVALTGSEEQWILS